jgi:hypothetical protein
MFFWLTYFNCRNEIHDKTTWGHEPKLSTPLLRLIPSWWFQSLWKIWLRQLRFHSIPKKIGKSFKIPWFQSAPISLDFHTTQFRHWKNLWSGDWNVDPAEVLLPWPSSSGLGGRGPECDVCVGKEKTHEETIVFHSYHQAHKPYSYWQTIVFTTVISLYGLIL